MYIVVIAWLYVAVMMAVAEATNTTGTLLGAFFTFVLYGAVPVSLVVYLMGRPARRRATKAREAAELARHRAAASDAPDGGGEAAAAAPVAPVRKEP
jgi:membrane protein implicated in regulation of membrane protease activity